MLNEVDIISTVIHFLEEAFCGLIQKEITLIGTGLEMYMSITEDFELSSVQTHITLLGWTTMTLAGFIYCLFPRVAQSILCKIQLALTILLKMLPIQVPMDRALGGRL